MRKNLAKTKANFSIQSFERGPGLHIMVLLCNVLLLSRIMVEQKDMKHVNIMLLTANLE